MTIHLKPELEALIQEDVERGYTQAERGELVDGEEAFRQLHQRHDQYRT
jgi:hypothetical protein